ncbi:BQ2448_5219 [Microbotryum intermedium]|uniref:chitinase n=1 Tax=Microbotryum intermedium TaxID=269621 RepID=A0A238F8V9_9BASI|nr:BQ2448_5219 [Microbotryum intermedium]
MAIPRPNGKVNVGYFTAWGIYARGYKPFPNVVPFESLTHILYAFAKIDSDGSVTLSDPWADEQASRHDQIHFDGDDWNEQGSNLYGNLKQLYLLKKRNRHLKILLSIGGWTYSPSFAEPCSTPHGRHKFVETSVKLLEDYGLDGLDIDWLAFGFQSWFLGFTTDEVRFWSIREYPKDDSQARDYVALLRELRLALDAHAQRKGLQPHQGYELSVAAVRTSVARDREPCRRMLNFSSFAQPCGPEHFEKLRIREMDQYLSFWNLMAYDYSGSWDTKAGHQANLFSCDPQGLSTDRALRHYTGQGVNVGKLVLGVPLYGRSFCNTDGPGHPYNGVGEGSWEKGTYDYKALPLLSTSEIFDPHLVTCHCYSPVKREFVTYDNAASAQAKAEFIDTNGLAGAMYWELSGDRAKGSQGNLVELVARTMGHLDTRQNCLLYSESKWDNMRKGL